MKFFMGRCFALAVIGLASFSTLPPKACWREPEVVLKVSDKGLGLGPQKVIGWAPDGTFVLQDSIVQTADSATVVLRFAPPEVLKSETGYKGCRVKEGLLKQESGCRTVSSVALQSCDGLIIRLLHDVGQSFFEVLPNGGFLKREMRESPQERKNYSEYGKWRYYEFDSEGRYIKEWTKPPEDLCLSEEYSYEVDRSSLSFPKRRFTFSAELFGTERLGTICTSAVIKNKWIVANNNAHAFDEEGRLLCTAPMQEWLNNVLDRIKQKDPSPVLLLYGSWEREVQWDDQGNAYFAISSLNNTYIIKMPWVEEDRPPITGPAKITPLDGWGMPLPTEPGPPNKAIESTGDIVRFLFLDQVLPLQNGLFPVYSLWDYQLSAFQRDNPGAIRAKVRGGGTVVAATERFVPNFAPQITLDMGKLETEGVITAWGPGQKGLPLKLVPWESVNRIPPANPLTIRRGTFCTHGPEDRYEIRAELDFKDDMYFNPMAPDIWRVEDSSVKPWVQHADLTLVETGNDTKVFVSLSVMTRMWLMPHDLPPNRRSTMKVYSHNWANGNEDRLELTETEPGSWRFVNADGSVSYEIFHAFNQDRKTIERPLPDSLDSLYLYITDPKLDLVRQPQLLFENGSDTGEYWSYAEPPPSAINACGRMKQWSYKPWWQVSEELEKAKFTLEAEGPSVGEGSVFRVLWDDPDGKTQHHDLPLSKGADGKYRTTTPLLCFDAQGCDIGGSWCWTDKIATPQVPGALTFRDNHVRMVVYSPDDLIEERKSVSEGK